MKAFEDLKESTKKDIIIDGLMRSKGVYLLVSKPKVGKSLFALQLANSIANGKPFLGHEILKPSPVLYITTELSDSQLKDRCNLLGISFKKNAFFAIDRSDKQSINFRDIEYEIKEFAEEYNGKILILDMLKDISFDISYDINSYQDISQKLMSKIRSYADKYNLTILFVHHLNKLGKTLGSTGFDAVVDGIIRLSKNCYDDSTIKMEIINRDFPNDEERTQFNIEYVGFDGHSTLSSKVYETIYTNNIHFNKGDNTNILNGCIVTSGPDFFRKLGLPMKDTGRVYVEGNHAGGPVFCPDINSKEDIPKKMLEYFNESYRFLSKYVEEKKCSLCRS